MSVTDVIGMPSAKPGRQTVSVVTATAIAIADMIGVGVFTSLGFQAMAMPSPFALLMLWIVGGIVALCGALSYAELAAAFPRSGGEYNFLSRTYHPALGFLAGWVSMTVGFAAPTALAAMAFGSYGAGVVPGVSPLALALGVTAIVTAVHLTGTRQGSVFQNVGTAIKITLVLVLMIAGFASGGANPDVSFAPTAVDLNYISSAPFAISLVFVMYAYSGWNAATYISDEIQDPQRSVPRSLIVSTLVVMLLYTGLNAAFVYSTPLEDLAGKLDVALVVGKNLFGDVGGRMVGALICIGLVSSISAMMWIGPRVNAVMGEDIGTLRWFSRRNESGVPGLALLFQAGVVVVLLLTGSFETVLDFIQFSLTLCSFLAVLGVIVLRFTQPDLPRPYRVPGYPLVPLIFLGVTGFMLVNLITERPLQSLAGLAVMLAGLIVYAASPKQVATTSTHGNT